MARTKSKPINHCEWTADDDGNWDTSCGEKFIILHGTPRENDMRFCCYCGDRLRERTRREGQ